jgi:hypothetical protein
VARALADAVRTALGTRAEALEGRALVDVRLRDVEVVALQRLVVLGDLRSSLTCPRNVRVGANSPSLCPTIASVTNTGTCLRPSCTAIVCPSMSGMIVERRDQVLITFLEPFSFCTSTFLSRWSSTNGPFFRLRGTAVYP